MPLHQSFLSFNSGEISDYLIYRNDFAKTSGAAQRMRNFLPLPFGAFSKRPGTVWLSAMLDGGANSKAFPFTASDGSRYVLHFTDQYLTIYRANGTVAASLAFVSGFSFASDSNQEFSIRGLQMKQVNDVAYFTHPRVHPLQLVSLSDTSWTLGFLPFERAPMMDGNLDLTKTYTVASNPVAATWALGASYAVGSKVYTNCEWICDKAHVASGANMPGVGASWGNYWRRMLYNAGDAITLLGDDRSEVAWSVSSYSYEVADLSSLSGEYYRCHEDYSTSGLASDYPNHSPDSECHWNLFWVYNDRYRWYLDWYTYLGGEVYQCILEHDADATTAPGIGGAWETYWVHVQPLGFPQEFRPSVEYLSGTRVSHEGLIYVCGSDHFPTVANRPGVGTEWTLISSGDTPAFATGPTSPGKYYKISPERDASDFQVELAATIYNHGAYSPPIVVEGAWNIYTFGTWSGKFTLERTINGGASWEVIGSWQSSADRNVSDAGFEDVPAMLRLRWFWTAEGSSNPRAILVPEKNSVTGFALMDTYVGTTKMTGHASTPMLSGNTANWAEGAFDLERGFPRALTLHGFRLWFASTVLNPVSIWASKINAFNNFETGVEDDMGIFRTLAASNHQPIRWMASTRRLFIGTSAGEWVEGSETSDTPITPLNVQFREYTPLGSCPHQPLRVNDGLFFLGRSGGRLYELGADESANGTFSGSDLSRLAEHLTAAGISNFAFQQTREPCLWAVTKSGDLLSFNYSRAESISAWAMHTTTGGQFRDVIVFAGDSGDDEVFFVVDRGSSSNLERFPKGWRKTQEEGTIGNYVDAAGKSGGDLPVLSELMIPPVDLQLDGGGGSGRRKGANEILDGGGTQGRRKRANEMLLNVFNSLGGGVTYQDERQEFNWARTSDLMNAPLSLKSGWVAVTLSPGFVEDLQFSIVHDENSPFTVRAAVLRWQLHEP